MDCEELLFAQFNPATVLVLTLILRLFIDRHFEIFTKFRTWYTDFKYLVIKNKLPP